MQTETKKYTYDDYAKLPEGSAYQLINGELIMSPAPNIYHQKIAANLFIFFNNYIEENKKGTILFSPVDVYFDENETYQPDIVFISKERNGIIKEKRIEGAPDIIIEVLSENNAYYDLKHKKNIYEKYGVKEYWIVDPMDKSIEVYNNEDAKFCLSDKKERKGEIKSKILSGLKIEALKVFNA